MKTFAIIFGLMVQQLMAQYEGNQASAMYAFPQPVLAPPAVVNPVPAPPAIVNPVPAPPTVVNPVPEDDQTASEAAGAGFEDPNAPKNSPFPLPECFMNDDGFLCCNKELEKLMSDTYEKLSQSRGGKWKKCNREQVSISVQRAAEAKYNHNFEVVTGAGDYASKNNFDANLICKIKREKSIILAYATPTFS